MAYNLIYASRLIGLPGGNLLFAKYIMHFIKLLIICTILFIAQIFLVLELITEDKEKYYENY